MTFLKTGQVAEILGVSPDTVRRWCDEDRLATTRTEGGQRQIEGRSLAAFLQAGLDLSASQIDGLQQLSARNRIPGIVTKIEVDAVVGTVEIRSGRHRITSVLTRASIEELGLVEGALATAIIKSTDVMMEVSQQ